MTRDSRKRVERQIAENSRVTGKLDSYFVSTSQRPEREWNFGTSDMSVSVTADIYTRPLNESLVFGHPDDSQGIGRGAFGDHRGEWTLEESIEGGVFTRQGRNTIVNSLRGTSSGMSVVSVGSDSSMATVSDESLGSEEGSTATSYRKPSPDEAAGFGSFRFSGFGDSVAEVGIDNQRGDLMARAAPVGVDPTSQQEVKVEITMHMDGQGTSGVAMTEDADEAIADSILSESEVVELESIAIGTGTAPPQESDSSLGNQVSEKDANRDWLFESVRVSMKWYENEPGGQPVSLSEMGVFDSDGRMIMRATFDPFEKDSEIETTFSAAIRIV